MKSSLAVITPTISRPTLRRTLESARLRRGDEWFVIGDGPQPDARRLVAELRAQGRKELTYLETEPTRFFGNHQRNIAMAQAQADYLIFLDDDDVFNRNAIKIIRRSVGEQRPYIFMMRNHPGEILWQKKAVVLNNIGGSMLVLPNDPAKLSVWPRPNDNYANDFQFIIESVEAWGEDMVSWVDEVIILCRPQSA